MLLELARKLGVWNSHHNSPFPSISSFPGQNLLQSLRTFDFVQFPWSTLLHRCHCTAHGSCDNYAWQKSAATKICSELPQRKKNSMTWVNHTISFASRATGTSQNWRRRRNSARLCIVRRCETLEFMRHARTMREKHTRAVCAGSLLSCFVSQHLRCSLFCCSCQQLRRADWLAPSSFIFLAFGTCNRTCIARCSFLIFLVSPNDWCFICSIWKPFSIIWPQTDQVNGTIHHIHLMWSLHFRYFPLCSTFPEPCSPSCRVGLFHSRTVFVGWKRFCSA